MPVYIARLVRGQTVYLTDGNKRPRRLVFSDAAAAQAFLAEKQPDLVINPAEIWFPKAPRVHPEVTETKIRNRHHARRTA